jgi:hypothetical protein
MNLNETEFFELLPKDGWWISDEDEIFRGPRSDMERQCPISSIDDAPEWNFAWVAEEYGISNQLQNRIIAAAHDLKPDDPACKRLRRRLLDHCGLVENE